MADLLDRARLEALRRTGLLDSGCEESLDRLTRLTAELLDVPMALVSLLDADRQVIKSAVGLDVTHTPLSHSFCRHVVADEAPLVVADARRDPRLRENGAIEAFGVVAYAGVPLRTAAGSVLGSLCAIAGEPREWSERDLRILDDLGAAVCTEIELRTAAFGLAAREAHLRTVVASAHDAFIEGDAEGRVVTWNPAASALFGWTAEEAVGRTVAELIVPEDLRGAHLATLARLTATAEPRLVDTPLQARAVHRDGRELVVEMTLAPFRSDAGLGFHAVIRDVTTRRAAEQERERLAAVLAESEQRLSRTIDDAPIGMALVACDGRWLRVNRALSRILGYEPDELLELTFQDLTHPDDLGTDLELRRQMLSGERESFSIDKRYLHKHGQTVWVRLSVSLVRDSEGAPLHFVSQMEDVTEARATARARREVEQRQALLLGSLPDTVIALYDPDMCCVEVKGALAKLGVREDEFLGKHLDQIVSARQTKVLEPLLARAFAGETVSAEYATERDTFFQLDIAPFLDSEGQIVGILTVWRDITERRAAEERLRSMFENAPIGNALLDLDGRITQANRALETICALPKAELEGMRLRELLHPADVTQTSALLSALVAGERGGLEMEVSFLSGAGHAVDVSLHAIVMNGGGGSRSILCQFQDISERKRYEAQLQFMADHDPLTGLFNRRRFEAELDRHLAHVKRYGASGAVVVLDIDNFKQVNDTLGHHGGDELIISLTGVLRARLRESDILGRLGGDEFAILLPHVGPEEAELVARSLVEAVRDKAILLGGQRHRVTVSVGVAMFARTEAEEIDDVTGDTLLVEADLAMYDAKDAGRNGYAMYATSGYQHSKTKARLTWAKRIEDALDHDGFALAAQPILDLRSGKTHQHELLLRMSDEQGDLIPPAAFLSVAERFGLIGRIDEWVSHRAIGLLEHHPDLQLEVNISGRSLGDAQLLASIEDRLGASAIDPSRLIFEITETAAVGNLAHAQAFAQRLRDLGCRFALDDFGAGFGSFYYLKHLPFDYIKIDGEFVRHVASGRTDQLVVDAVVQIARGMGKETIAEFVADERIQRAVTRLGVDFAQGYHISKPVPLEQLLGGCGSAQGREADLPGPAGPGQAIPAQGSIVSSAQRHQRRESKPEQ